MLICFIFSRMMVVALQEKIAAFDAYTFKSRFCITSECFKYVYVMQVLILILNMYPVGMALTQSK